METKHKNHLFWSFYTTYLAKIFMKFAKMKWNHKSQFYSSVESNVKIVFRHICPSAAQIAADNYYDFEIVNMKSLQDWIVYMLTIPSWHFFSKNIQN